ncbi:MAG: DUF3427 domain-containing protein [Solirubrobacteraceae bacterium]|nr:DUF3427 domain-containing protein [Solirubrobacteraceae bacterium]
MSGPFDASTPGPRDHLVTRALEQALADLEPDSFVTEDLEVAEAPRRLARHLGIAVQQALTSLAESSDDALAAQATQLNTLLDQADPEEVGDLIAFPPRILTELRTPAPAGGYAKPARLPKTPLGQSDLLVNAVGQPNIGSELQAELATATRVDLLCAFVILSGVSQLREALRGVIDRGGEVRVITTTYMGATERAAVDALVELGATVKIALDARTTKLHAKAWLIERPAEMTTAFIGSSNLSHTALFDGLEWNVRLSTQDAPFVVDRVRTMFAAHWASEQFDDYDPAVRPADADRLDAALASNNLRRSGTADVPFAAIDVRAYPHQQRMLDRLDVERNRHDRHRNLIVAATGTGKTVVAALDYRRLCSSAAFGGSTKVGRRPSLLFVAHREEILRQALATYRQVLSDPGFGELHGGGTVGTGRHLFAMVQTLTHGGRELPAADEFDVVVVDEFHHAEASTYKRLLGHLESRELLGLTATPERGDQLDILHYFDGRIAAELRLWEAIDEGFLVPFQYFGVADDVDLSQLTWSRGDYDRGQIERLYTANDGRVIQVLRALRRVVARPEEMRALGFCVGKAHAHFMAASFNRHGLPSVALTGEDSTSYRNEVLNQLRQGQLRCVFSVDVLSEGVDVPSADTVLLLRPTQSPVVFAQQLGRGLRLADGKSHLTVLDLIGQQHREFRMQDRLGVLIDRRRGPVLKQVEEAFPFLPAGCSIVLEQQAQETVLEHLRAAAKRGGVAAMAADLRAHQGDGDLAWFLDSTSREVDDLYRASKASWTAVRRAAGRSAAEGGPDVATEARLLEQLRRLRHLDDAERTRVYGEWLSGESALQVHGLGERDRRLARMLVWGVWGGKTPAGGVQAGLDALWGYPAVRDELRQLLGVLDARSSTLTRPSALAPEVPLSVHARYTRPEIIAALRPDGDAPAKPFTPQAGVHREEAAGADLFFVTLRKTERDYSPTTMYRDYAITRDRFHWESQAKQHTGLEAVQRYIHHAERGSNVLLFVREANDDDLGATTPFMFLGPLRYLSHEGERPVRFTWKLETPMPEEMFEVARSVAVA